MYRSVPISHKQIHDWEQGLQRQVIYVWNLLFTSYTKEICFFLKEDP